MKVKSYLSIGIVILCTLTVAAQHKAGIRIGTHINQVDVKGVPSVVSGMTKSFAGLKVSGYLETILIDNISVVGELGYTQKGFAMAESTSFNLLGLDIPVGVSTDVNLNYVELPILLKYYFKTEGIKLSVEGGPSLSYALNGQLKPRATLLLSYNLPQVDIDFTSEMYRRVELGGNIGIGAEYPIANTGGALVANVRYTKAFTNVLADSLIDIDVKNRGWSMGVGYTTKF